MLGHGRRAAGHLVGEQGYMLAWTLVLSSVLLVMLAGAVRLSIAERDRVRLGFLELAGRSAAASCVEAAAAKLRTSGYRAKVSAALGGQSPVAVNVGLGDLAFVVTGEEGVRCSATAYVASGKILVQAELRRDSLEAVRLHGGRARTKGEPHAAASAGSGSGMAFFNPAQEGKPLVIGPAEKSVKYRKYEERMKKYSTLGEKVFRARTLYKASAFPKDMEALYSASR